MNTTRIIQELSAGNLVIAPTDTIYGILADATDPTAAQKVIAAKQRDVHKPLIILVSDFEMMKRFTTKITPLEQKIVEQYMPGKLTILLPRSSEIPAIVPGKGIRIPDHAELRALIREFGRPLISTSANLAGAEPITNPEQISPEMLQYISYVKDAGTINSEPSSLIEVQGEELHILRPGAVATELSAHWAELLQSL